MMKYIVIKTINVIKLMFFKSIWYGRIWWSLYYSSK